MKSGLGRRKAVISLSFASSTLTWLAINVGLAPMKRCFTCSHVSGGLRACVARHRKRQRASPLFGEGEFGESEFQDGYAGKLNTHYPRIRLVGRNLIRLSFRRCQPIFWAEALPPSFQIPYNEDRACSSVKPGRRAWRPRRYWSPWLRWSIGESTRPSLLDSFTLPDADCRRGFLALGGCSDGAALHRAGGLVRSIYLHATPQLCRRTFWYSQLWREPAFSPSK